MKSLYILHIFGGGRINYISSVSYFHHANVTLATTNPPYRHLLLLALLAVVTM